MTQAQVHPSAIIGNNVTIGEGTVIGPFCIVEDDVTIGSGNLFKANAFVGQYTKIGDDNTVFPFSTIGLPPQDLKFNQEESSLEMGSGNTVREHVTLHRGTSHGGGVTRIGDGNLFMVGSHAGHDCQVGNRSILSHGCALAGHVTVGDDATVGAASSVHQFCHVGDHAFIGGHSVVVQDALPYIKTVGNRAKIYGVNNIGLERKGFTAQEVKDIKKAYRILFLKRLPLSEALDQVEKEYPQHSRIDYLVQFIRTALEHRGITR